MNKIILVTGKRQSGKDTTCDYCLNYLNAKKYSFATPLKDFLINVFGLSYEQCYGTNDDKNTRTDIKWSNLPFARDKIIDLYLESRPKSWIASDHNGIVFSNSTDDFMTAREVMQIFGSNICRKMYSDCWANATRNAILSEIDYSVAFVADVRFPNELEVFKDLDPIVIRLSRHMYDSSHISETALDNYDFSKFKKYLHIDNTNMSLEEKNKTALRFINSHL